MRMGYCNSSHIQCDYDALGDRRAILVMPLGEPDHFLSRSGEDLRDKYVGCIISQKLYNGGGANNSAIVFIEVFSSKTDDFPECKRKYIDIYKCNHSFISYETARKIKRFLNWLVPIFVFCTIMFHQIIENMLQDMFFSLSHFYCFLLLSFSFLCKFFFIFCCYIFLCYVFCLAFKLSSKNKVNFLLLWVRDISFPD